MNKSKIDFIKTPDLPKEKICSAIIGEGHESIYNALESCSIKLYVAADNLKIHSSASNHADMSAFHFGNGEILLDKEQTSLAEQLRLDGYKVELTEEKISGEYPLDIRLNCFSLDNILYCKEKYVDEKIKERFKNIENVKQGYAKCSVFKVNENSAITDDESIYKILNKNKINCLLIEKGNIYLDASHYGFIGGSSFMYNKSTAVFFGNIQNHKNYHLIKSFLLNLGIYMENLLNGQLTDIGGIIPLAENIP